MFDFIITLLPGSAEWTHLSKTMITVLQWSRRAFNKCLHPIFSAFFEGRVIKKYIILNTGCFMFNFYWDINENEKHLLRKAPWVKESLGATGDTNCGFKSEARLLRREQFPRIRATERKNRRPQKCCFWKLIKQSSVGIFRVKYITFPQFHRQFYQNICLIVFLLQHMYRPKWTASSRNPIYEYQLSWNLINAYQELNFFIFKYEDSRIIMYF